MSFGKFKKVAASALAVLFMLALLPAMVFAANVSALVMVWEATVPVAGTKVDSLPTTATDSGNANTTYTIAWSGASGADKDSNANKVYKQGDTPIATVTVAVGNGDTLEGTLASAPDATDIASLISGLPGSPDTVKASGGSNSTTELLFVATYAAIAADTEITTFAPGLTAPAFGGSAPAVADFGTATDEVKYAVTAVTGATAGNAYEAGSDPIVITMTATAQDGYTFNTTTWGNSADASALITGLTGTVAITGQSTTAVTFTVTYAALENTVLSTFSSPLTAPVVGASAPATGAQPASGGIVIDITGVTGSTAGSAYAVGETPEITFTATAQAGYEFNSSIVTNANSDFFGDIGATNVNLTRTSDTVLTFVVTYPKLLGKIAALAPTGIDLPAKAGTPDAAGTDSTTGLASAGSLAVSWAPVTGDSSGDANDQFAIGDIPVATITVTAGTDYYFDPTVWAESADASALIVISDTAVYPEGTVVAITVAPANDNTENSVTYTITYPAIMEVLSAFDLDLTAPVIGATPDTAGANATTGVNFDIAWTDDGGDPISTFEPGHTPLATITATPQANYSFDAASFADASNIGGNVGTGNETWVSGTSAEVVYTVDYAMLIEELSALELAMAAPAIGSTAPSMTVTEEGVTAMVDFGATATGEGDVFAVGDEPVATVTLTADTGYEFDDTALNAYAVLTTTGIDGSPTDSGYTASDSEISFTLTYDMLTEEVATLAPVLETPALGATVPTTIDATDEATYTISWSGVAGNAYASGDAPVATIVATAETGYVFDTAVWDTALDNAGVHALITSLPDAALAITASSSSSVTFTATYPAFIGITSAVIVDNADPDKILVTLDDAVPGMDNGNFDVKKSGTSLTSAAYTVATADAGATYTITLNDALSYGDEIEVGIAFTGYVFNGGEYAEVVTTGIAPKGIDEVINPGTAPGEISLVPNTDDASAPAQIVGIDAVSGNSDTPALTLDDLKAKLNLTGSAVQYDLVVSTDPDNAAHTTGAIDPATTPLGTGMLIQLVDDQGNAVGDPVVLVIKGDVTGTGACDLRDIVQAAQHMMGDRELGGAYLAAADMGTGNPGVDITDLVNLANMSQLLA